MKIKKYTGIYIKVTTEGREVYFSINDKVECMKFLHDCFDELKGETKFEKYNGNLLLFENEGEPTKFFYYNDKEKDTVNRFVDMLENVMNIKCDDRIYYVWDVKQEISRIKKMDEECFEKYDV